MSSDSARQLAISSPAGFAHVCSGGLWVPYEHLILLNDHLLRLVSGEIDRLIVTMPPQHGKSELISKWFPAWYLGAHPTEKVMLGSYQKTYAASWGRKARETLEEFGPPLFGVGVAEEPRTAEWWFTDQGGYMASDGLGGAFTGKGSHLLIIDDPIKGHEEAHSEVMRAKAWDWWVATLASRLQQKNAVVLVQTRWHEDDLAGRLLVNEADEWVVLNLPALAEENDALGRELDEPLCPELHDREKLERQRKKGAYWWASLYQQRPAPAEGFLFKRKNFRYWREEIDTSMGAVPRKWFVLIDGEDPRRVDAGYCAYFQTVDAAISEKETADFSVVATWAATPSGDLLLLKVERKHFEQQELVDFLAGANIEQGRPPMWIERFGAGRNPLAVLTRRGHPVAEIPAEAGAQSDKITRAFGAIFLYEQHKVFHPAGQPGWLGDFESELVTFPNGAHDDQVDVTAYAARLLPQVRAGHQGARRDRPDAPKPHSAGLYTQRF